MPDAGRRLRWPSRTILALFLVVCPPMWNGCSSRESKDYWNSGGEATSDEHIIRRDGRGPILLVISDYALDPAALPGGMYRAALNVSWPPPWRLSSAVFHRNESEAAWRWLAAEISTRRHQGEIPRVALAGAGMAGAAASELAWRALRGFSDVVVEMLVTVDAVKPGTVARTAGMATAALHPVPRARRTAVAYTDAPVPDRIRFRAHHNYWQNRSAFRHGAPMPGATLNEKLAVPSGAVNHATVEDYAYPLARADLERALWGHTKGHHAQPPL